eukprot:jgi/Psemu1/36772/gm1.36772_g
MMIMTYLHIYGDAMRKQKKREVQAYRAGLLEEAVGGDTPIANKYDTNIQWGIHHCIKGKGEANITLAEVLQYNKSTRLKNSEIEETSIKMTTQEKQIGKLENDFQTVAMMQSIKEMKDCKKKNSTTSIIEHISAKKYIPLKHQYQLPTEIRMKIAGMYAIHKDWMQKDSGSYSKLVGQEERWIDFKQHWNTRLKILYQACGYKVPEEICMQKAMCALLIAKLPWNVANLANVDWWNRMGTIDRENMWHTFKIHWTCHLEKINVENNTKYLANNVGISKKERKAFRFKSSNKRNSPNKKKIKKAEEASKEENKSGNQQKGRTMGLRLYSNSKQALEILLEKMGKEKPIDSEINLEGKTPEQTLEKIAASHNMTVEELLVGNNILKDDNQENLPEENIQWLGKKKDYKELSSNDDSNENGEAEEDRMSDKEEDESSKERSTHREEEDKKNKEEADPIEVTTDPALQLGDTENIEEKAAKATDPIENNEREEKRQHGKIIYQCCHHGCKNKW